MSTSQSTSQNGSASNHSNQMPLEREWPAGNEDGGWTVAAENPEQLAAGSNCPAVALMAEMVETLSSLSRIRARSGPAMVEVRER